MKWGVLVVAIVITIASIVYTNHIVRKLKEREAQLVELYAKTIEYAVNVGNRDEVLFLTQNIIVPNNSIPVILTDGVERPLDFRNINIDPKLSPKERQKKLRELVQEMKEEHDPVQIVFTDENGQVYDYNYVFYKNSFLLDQLTYYPIVQLSVIAFFIFLVFYVYSNSKTNEQNRVWIGLAKETAHQLGTPLSSLVAWIEYLKADEDFNYPEVLEELEKDTHRLETITNRFSSIGSIPTLEEENLYEVIRSNVEYLSKRISTKVKVNVETNSAIVMAPINRSLFNWVIENLIKNAVDAMKAKGQIDINLVEGPEGGVVLDITDSGPGIPKDKINKIFIPGYSTKKRGWGLGLTLTKRIVENYHQGKIFVKHSSQEDGTTFRILLPGKDYLLDAEEADTLIGRNSV